MKKTLLLLSLLFVSYGISQEKSDTLFIKYDDKLLQRKQHPIDDSFYYIIKGSGNNGIIFFKEKSKKLNTLKNNNSIRLKRILRKSEAYFKKNKLDDFKLSQYFHKKKYTSIYLVKDSILYEVDLIYSIE